MTPLYDVTPLIVSHVPQVPDPIAAQCLVLTARELCRATNCWKYEATDVDVTEGDPLVSFYDMPPDSQMVQVEEVLFNNCVLRPVALDQLTRQDRNWTTQSGTPFGYYLGAENNQIRLVYTPGTGGSLYARLSLEPTLSAGYLDSMLLDRHLDTLVAGVLSRVLRYPDRSWTNFALAGVYTAQYEQAKRVIRSQAADGFQVGVPRSVCYGGI